MNALVVGGGPAGLATSRELSARGIEHRVLERGDAPGHVWANLYDGLVLHTGKHLSHLPGLAFPKGTPLFPSRQQFVEYLHRYVERFRLPVSTGVGVERVERSDDGWTVHTRAGDPLHARVLVWATGIVSNPQWPRIPIDPAFRHRVMHSVNYKRPGAFAGQRVLVVGCGNSAAEISAELAHAGVEVTIAVRSGAQVVPRQLLGIPVQYFAVVMEALPPAATRAIRTLVARAGTWARGGSAIPRRPDRPCAEIPLIGFHLMDAIKAGAVRLKPGVEAITASAARFTDGSEGRYDWVVLATGYRAAVAPLGSLVHTDECGFAMRRGRVLSADQPDLYFVGHNYDMRGGIKNISTDARLTGELLAGESIRTT